MPSTRRNLLAAAGQGESLYVEDVFSTYLYTGTGSTQTITNGIDLDGEGGMVWIKNRTNGANHTLFNTVNGVNKYAVSNDVTTGILSVSSSLTAFNTTGFDLGSVAAVNTNTDKYASWSFRQADGFFFIDEVVKAASVTKTVDLSSLGTVGMVAVRRTDAAGSWYVWHKDLTAGKLLLLESTASEATLGQITMSGTTLSLVDGSITDGTYDVYAWAHDDQSFGAGGDESIIKCGIFTSTSAVLEIDLGWEPQYIVAKQSDGPTGWYLIDCMRGFQVDRSGATVALYANTSAAEAATGLFGPNANGFEFTNGTPGQNYIYIAIRRPMKVPEAGTEVYSPVARTGAGGSSVVTAGFPVDLVIAGQRNSYSNRVSDRLRGTASQLQTMTTAAETAFGTVIEAFDNNTGYTAGSTINTAATDYINYAFKRAPGFMDVVCYIGTGSAKTEAHGLGVAPELMIFKKRSAAEDWTCYVESLGTGNAVYLNTTGASNAFSYFNSTAPTASVFSIGTSGNVNANTATYVAYLFATLEGISKVGSYTADATLTTIDCGFTTGARFILIKRTDSTGDWYMYDSARGIVAGNDPYLLLNDTAAEVTSTDYIDPSNSGFDITAAGSSTINIDTAEYIYLAIA